MEYYSLESFLFQFSVVSKRDDFVYYLTYNGVKCAIILHKGMINGGKIMPLNSNDKIAEFPGMPVYVYFKTAIQ